MIDASSRPSGRAPARSLRIAFILVLFGSLAACAGAALPQSPQPTPAPSSSPTDAVGGSGSDGSTGSGDVGVGIDVPAVPGPGGVTDPLANPDLVDPKPGRLNPQDAGISRLEGRVEGRHAWVRASFWGGVAPCFSLDSTSVTRSGTTITVGLRAGADQKDGMCIDIAKLYATVVDLGELEPGTYTVRPATGDAPAITVVVR
jgi:hypothetical protein